MEIINIEQGSDEWYQVRRMKMTASHAQAIAACGAGLETYILDMCSEFFSTKEKEIFANQHTERGNAYEDQARVIYELQTGNKVEQVGFVVHSDHVGCSPDGLVNDDGLVEFKNPSDKEHFRFMVDNKIKPEYEWQMQMQMLVTGREWCDFVSYNPNFENCIVIKRVTPDDKKLEKLLKGFEAGGKRIKEIISQCSTF
jgi:exodeoxyribonuclease (lambda-induced)